MIKKTLLVLLTGVGLVSFAQESADSIAAPKKKKERSAQTSDFKPESGAVSVDFTANNLFKLFSGGDQFQLSDDAQGFGGGIRLRYFLSPDLAIRTNLITDFSSVSGFPVESDPINGLDIADGASGEHQQAVSHFAVSLGAEKHFDGTNRLDTYVGGELLADWVMIEEQFTNVDATGTFVEGYRATTSGALKGKEAINLSNSNEILGAAGFGVGLRGCVGADFYVFPKVYLGAELGIAVMQKWITDYKLTEVDPRDGTTKAITVTNRGHALNVGQDINAQFRIGFRL